MLRVLRDSLFNASAKMCKSFYEVRGKSRGCGVFIFVGSVCLFYFALRVSDRVGVS